MEKRLTYCLNFQGSKGNNIVGEEICHSILRMHGNAIHVVFNPPKVVGKFKVGFVVDPLASNSMKSANPNSGFHQEEYSTTLDTSSQNPIRNGGGMLVVQSF